MKKWWWVFLLGILGAMLTIGILAAITVSALKNTLHLFEPMDGPGMVYTVDVDEIEYVENDNVNGGYYKITATRGATAHIVMERVAKQGAEPVIVEADADAELLTQIGEVIVEAGLERAGKYTERDPYVMPDATSHMKIVEPFYTFTITSLMELSREELAAENKIVSLLEQALGETMYRLELGSGAYGIQNARESYPAGAQVVLYYGWIATDTDYHFYLDGEPIGYNIDDDLGIVISFTMPAHDVTFSCEKRNSMEIDPDAE